MKRRKDVVPSKKRGSDGARRGCKGGEGSSTPAGIKRGGEKREGPPSLLLLSPSPLSILLLILGPGKWTLEEEEKWLKEGARARLPPEGIKEHGRRNGNPQRLIVMLQTGKVASSES